MKKADLQDKTKAELLELASDNEVEGRSAMSKDELVEALAKIRNPKSTGAEAKTIMTTPRDPEEQNSLGYSTRDGEEDLTFEQPPAVEGDADSTSLGGSVTGVDADTTTTATPTV